MLLAKMKSCKMQMWKHSRKIQLEGMHQPMVQPPASQTVQRMTDMWQLHTLKEKIRTKGALIV